MQPLYEAKMIHHFDTRWATYEPDGSTRLMTEAEKADRMPPMPRYWVEQSEVEHATGGEWKHRWFLSWRRIARSTDERTMLTSMGPWAAYGDSLFLMFTEGTESRRLSLQSVLSSFVVDYVFRQKLGGTNASFYFMSQLTVARPDAEVASLRLDRRVESWIDLRVELLNGWVADEARRRAIRAELDAYCFHLYGCSRDEVDYIMETFPIVKRKDVAAFGDFRTKEMILRAYDAMAESIATGAQYTSHFREVPA